MKIKVLNKNIQSFKENLDGKRRIMTYGAGSWACAINRMLNEYGYKLDCAIVDNQFYDGDAPKSVCDNSMTVTLIENLCPSYNPKLDAIIWAIGSPDKFHDFKENDQVKMECLLCWDMFDFWCTRDYASIHYNEFKEASEQLCDEYSKKVFWGYLEALAGNIEDDILLSTNGTYFNELTKKKRRGVFLDCGSYDGESSLEYMKFYGEECKVYAFEPDKNNYQILVNRMKNHTNVICLNKGCYSSERVLSFVSNGDMSSGLQENGNDSVEVTLIDKIIGDEKVAFIKMDIEGAELEALKGARTIIERDMPILAISAYHKQEDLITLIPYINNLRNENERYDLYLRHHGVSQTELVIYGIPVDEMDNSKAQECSLKNFR